MLRRQVQELCTALAGGASFLFFYPGETKAFVPGERFFYQLFVKSAYFRGFSEWAAENADAIIQRAN